VRYEELAGTGAGAGAGTGFVKIRISGFLLDSTAGLRKLYLCRLFYPVLPYRSIEIVSIINERSLFFQPFDDDFVVIVIRNNVRRCIVQ
jgi:hypothetical protein